MAEKHKKIALSHIAEVFAENKAENRDIWFSGGVSANFDFVPQNILAWTTRETPRATGTFIHQRMALALILMEQKVNIAKKLLTHRFAMAEMR